MMMEVLRQFAAGLTGKARELVVQRDGQVCGLAVSPTYVWDVGRLWAPSMGLFSPIEGGLEAAWLQRAAMLQIDARWLLDELQQAADAVALEIASQYAARFRWPIYWLACNLPHTQEWCRLQPLLMAALTQRPREAWELCQGSNVRQIARHVGVQFVEGVENSVLHAVLDDLICLPYERQAGVLEVIKGLRDPQAAAEVAATARAAYRAWVATN